MSSAKWTAFAIGYQCVFAYAIALMINQFGTLIQKIAGYNVTVSVIGVIVAVLVLAGMIYMLVRPYNENGKKLVKAA